MGCNDMPTRGQPRITGARNGANLIFTLASAEVFPATALVAGGLFNEYVVTGDDFERLGPAIQDIVVHAEGSNFTPNYSYDVVLQYKYDLGNWTTITGATQLILLQTATPYVIGTAFGDRTKLGLRLRILIRTQITAGSTNSQSGTLSATAAVRLYCG